MSINPIHQFEIKKIIAITFLDKYTFYLTNLMISLLEPIGIAFLIYIGFSRYHAIVPNRIQAFFEILVVKIYHFIDSNIDKNVKRKVPFVFAIFLFILFINLFGLIPHSLVATSHISVTFTLALIVFVSALILNIVKLRSRFFTIFIPSGTPIWMAPLIFVLEFFSFFIRPVSLSIRLTANMMAGHVIIEILAAFTILLKILGIFPMLFLVIIYCFEFAVCLLQAYIFSIFTCVYINEASGGH